MKTYIDYGEAKEYFLYDPKTGYLTNRFSRGRGGKKGDMAGSVKISGTNTSPKHYYRLRYNGKFIYAHRVIWVLMTGQQPDEVDHIDGDGLNNKWDNLRNVSHLVSGHNQRKSSSNTSGASGVTYRKDSGKWRSRIMVNDNMINLGTFINKQDAITARREAEVKYYEMG
jgi:hypothetical protein